ncbi:TPA: CDP-alcohol phosphatidyltransferase family protein [Legionella pneumophila]|uniref:CDP-alcohol phosphatidyltransferase family protein n=1 Tax=Legionella pneumophila TaxID=446 RepID=A0AAN5KQ94_LEGPN|nr:CDP-alcohol phosphatidyltransferase family protein [Legionella pneumophila]HAT1971008.1 CDP-alcohol phosphatidyltransferase family protein [Legionella pneumophila]HAT6955815.1 CDP-alcohol phosphatidyltransferase family protein [Legionella pneumophila]HEN4770141.1 CDP-alcohol phosphatidyltransferase family protein [Legionella pneumophila]
MLEQSLRHYYQLALVDPILPALRDRITPLSITWLSGILGLLFIPFVLLDKPCIAISFLLLSGYLDTLDGSLARFQNKASDFGSAMDIIMDRIVEFSAVLALYLFDPQHRATLTILMLGSILLCITSFLVVGIFSNNTSQKSFYYSPGIMERAEAFLFFIVMTLFPDYFNFLAAVFCFLVCLTALIRLFEFKRSVQASG